MKFTIRLVSAIWLSVLTVLGGFAFLQIQEERERLLDDLKRRAVLVGEGLKEAIEPQVARGSTVGLERVLKRFGRPTRGIAVYDRFAGLLVDVSFDGVFPRRLARRVPSLHVDHHRRSQFPTDRERVDGRLPVRTADLAAFRSAGRFVRTLHAEDRHASKHHAACEEWSRQRRTRRD